MPDWLSGTTGHLRVADVPFRPLRKDSRSRNLEFSSLHRPIVCYTYSYISLSCLIVPADKLQLCDIVCKLLVCRDFLPRSISARGMSSSSYQARTHG
jgi:hypothetical protein